MSDSRIGGLYRRSIGDRIDELEARGWLAPADAETLREGRAVLGVGGAERMIENVIGVFGLPLAVAPNFVIDGRDYVVPMVVEEPSVVAALANAARLARAAGGFTVSCEESLLTGQVVLLGVADPDAAEGAIRAQRDALLAEADAVHPRLAARGGGVRDLELHRFDDGEGGTALALHIHVDTRDAMGANLVNTICERLAPRVAALCGGRPALRILSNLADRSLVTARVTYTLGSLAESGADPVAARDGIVAASRIAGADPYRAATHNKGIMNGIDAVAIATGNDWRAVEAGAHAWAARQGRYGPLATWRTGTDGSLEGEIRLPLKVGTVGGTLARNPAARLCLRLLDTGSARDLAGVMAAVGLAQNFAALRALATTGIQHGHMRLHARGKPAGSRVIAGPVDEPGTAAGKVILLGEHAVVYGRHALALPIPGAVTARVSAVRGTSRISVPDWHLEHPLAQADAPLSQLVARVLGELGLADTGYHIEIASQLPRGMGLGSSAAFAVALVRAFAAAAGIDVDPERTNAIAFECEHLAHGTPSGVDNTLATFARPMLFRHAGELEIRTLEPGQPPPLVIATSSGPGATAAQVAAVRARRTALAAHYDAVFDEMDALAIEGAALLEANDLDRLGRLMNLCHGLLNALEVSTPELEMMVRIARSAGAAGAKLTGAGGGGSVVALCPGNAAAVAQALEDAGFPTLVPAVS